MILCSFFLDEDTVLCRKRLKPPLLRLSRIQIIQSDDDDGASGFSFRCCLSAPLQLLFARIRFIIYEVETLFLATVSLAPEPELLSV